MAELNLSKFIETIPVRSSEKLRVDERLTYHFESADIGLVHWERLAKSLSQFYSMCGHARSNPRPRSDLRYFMAQLQIKAHRPSFPLHNPVAFFHCLTGSNCEKEMLNYLFRTLLPYALSCSGIVFGTAYDREGIHTARPCDMEYIDPVFDDPNIYMNLIKAQAQLKSGHRFKSDFTRYTNAVSALARQREIIIEWCEEWESENTRKPDHPPFSRPLPWSGDLDKLTEWEDMFFSFLDLYEDYCKSQFSDNSLSQRKTCTQMIQDVRLSAQFIFQMERITVPLLDSLKIEDPEQNYAHRKQWIENTRTALMSGKTISQLNALKRCFKSNFDALTNENHLFTYISSNKTLVPNQYNLYPLLNERTVFRRLNKIEKRALFWYRKLPVAHWIEQICSPSSKVRKILPFFLCYFFWNKEKPFRPFDRFEGRFTPKSLPLNSDIAFCTHVHAVRLQKSHHKFYLDTITWCKQYYPGEADLPLCHALYTFHRRHLVTEPPSPENYHLPNHLNIIYQGLLRLFDFPVSLLPQYTENPITENEFNYFFYVDTSQEVKQIRKHIRSLITDELANTYGKLAFLDPDGFGHSYFTKKWHQNLATWLSDLINEDRTLSAYVSCGNPNLAQIELAIQFSCCQRLQQIWANDVLHCYKNCLSPK